MPSVSQRNGLVMLHAQVLRLALHAPFQHTLGASLGQLCSHVLSSATQAPSFCAHRYGIVDGQGHCNALCAHDMSQHCTSGAAHVAEQVAFDATHAPFEQRNGSIGEHGHCASDPAHDESQHCTLDDGHFRHMSRDVAQRPVSEHVTYPGGHARRHVPFITRHRGNGHALPAAIASHGMFRHSSDVVLKKHVRFDSGDKQSCAFVKSEHCAAATDAEPPTATHCQALLTWHRSEGHASAEKAVHASVAAFGSIHMLSPLSCSTNMQPCDSQVVELVANAPQRGLMQTPLISLQPFIGH